MSSDDNHRRADMTPMARNICTRAVFTTSSFNFGLQTFFGSHYCLFYKVDQSCLKWCGK